MIFINYNSLIKIGFRYNFGESRGKNRRTLDIKKYKKERFRLLCPHCHRKYDKDNPLTEEELQKIEEAELAKVPF